MKDIKKPLLIVGVVIVGLIVGICIIAVMAAKSKQISLGKTTNIKEENVEVTVLSSEKATIDDPTGILLESGDFIKVKVRVKNNGSTPYTWNKFWTFRIGENYVAMTPHNDDLPSQINAGSTEEGYLYFKYTDESIMDYYTPFKSVDNNRASTSKYSFKIK